MKIKRLRLPRPRAVTTLGVALAIGAAAVAEAAPVPIKAEVRVRRVRVVGDTYATGKLTAAVKASAAKLDACYAKARARAADEVGVLSLNVLIAKSGQTRVDRVLESGVDKGLLQCVSRLIARWRLTPWKAGNDMFGQIELVFQLLATPRKWSYIKGGVPPKLVAGPVEVRLPGLLKSCVTTAPEKARTIKLNIVVDFDGSVQSAGVKGRVHQPAIRRCIETRLKKWDFPPPDNGHRTWVWYPVKLVPAAGGAGKAR